MASSPLVRVFVPLRTPRYNCFMPRPPRAGFPPPSLINTSDALGSLCDRLASESFITVDTEFMRERTYWPELCVVQLAGYA